MSSLPLIFPDNNYLNTDNTVIIRNNVVRDCKATTPVVGIEISNHQNVVAKNNKVSRMNNQSGTCFGMVLNSCDKVFLQYNAVSRCNVGSQFNGISTLYVYNYTAHNCMFAVDSNSSGIFRNLSISSWIDTKYYKNSIIFSLDDSAVIDVDYMYYFNTASMYTGNGIVGAGANVEEKEILYMDEQSDDLTPDPISEIVNAGTTNLLGETTVDIGGVASEVTDDVTAQRNYHYDLMDNAFWDVENAKSVEVSFVRAFQSRIMAGSELANKSVEYNTYIKYADSLTRFTELYPMYARYCTATQFKKRVMDVWYAGQNCGTAQAYQSAIGGYNLLPSFIKRLEDVSESWSVGESYIDIDNYLLGTDEHKFGIGIDVLGWSTLTMATSAECYRNTMNSIADLAPVYWLTHEEVQPSGYVVLANGYNDFGACSLSNMMYSDEYTIIVNDIGSIAQLETPVLLLTNVVAYTLGTATSGQIELSVLDRVYSEEVSRNIYYRVGTTPLNLGSWRSVSKTVGEVIETAENSYIQFKITIANLPRQIDYEFVSLAFRGNLSSRVWNYDS